MSGRESSHSLHESRSEREVLLLGAPTVKPFTAEDMDVLLAEFSTKTVELLKSKANDYAGKGDRLKNFREVAAATNTTPEQVCLIYMMKHIQALSNMASRGDYVWDWQKPDGSEGAKQRVADAINYLFLLAGIMEDRQRNLPTPVSLTISEITTEEATLRIDAAMRAIRESEKS